MLKAEGFVQSGDVNIHYLAKKALDPNQMSLLFVPGIMMPAWIWEKQLDYFSTDYNAIAMDPRSQGESGHSSEGHYAYAMAQDIHAVVEALDLRQLILIGWSIAVPQVLNYAAHFRSKRLVALALVDGIVGINSTLPFYHSMVELWTEFQKDRSPKTRELIKIMFQQPQPTAYFEKLYEVAMRTPTNTVMTLIQNYMLQDFHSLLPKIDLPTWIATIEGPRLEYMRNMQKLLPCANLEIFSDAGHALFVDQPEKFNSSLKAFLDM
jgi:non-heme chloroperoxidase